MQNAVSPEVFSDLPEGTLSNMVLLERRLYLMDTLRIIRLFIRKIRIIY